MYKEKNLHIQTGPIKKESLSYKKLTSPTLRFAVNRLILTNFRNYDRLSIKLTDEPVILIGANGSGKTNILEALSLLVPGRGLRQAKYSHLSCISGDSSWAVNADIKPAAPPPSTTTS